MKTLTDHTLLYDEACPLCQWYTGAFVKHGFLDAQGRTAYCTTNQAEFRVLDADRARHEIALVHRPTGQVRYGLDGLTHILSHRWYWLKPLLRATWLRTLLQPLYNFISYNRKVIALDSTPPQQQACVPDFHWGYRIAYLVVALLFTAGIVTQVEPYLTQWVPQGGFGREVLILGGVLLVQGVALWRADWRTRIHYLGHTMTIALIGALLLWPLVLGAPILVGLGAGFYAGWFCAVVAIMFYLHIKRVKGLRLPGYLTFTWLAYRLAVLALLVYM